MSYDVTVTFNVKAPSGASREVIQQALIQRLLNDPDIRSGNFDMDYEPFGDDTEPALTANQRQKYLRDGGAKCPFCGSKEIEGAAVNCEGDHHTQIIECQKCEREWMDVYKLNDIQDV